MALKVGELFASFGIDSSGVDGALSGVEKKCSGIASSMTSTGAVLSATLTAPIVKFGKDIYTAGTEFYSQMDRVGALSGVTAEELQALTDEAILMGSTTSFTATEAGQALEYMAMAGWKSDQMLSGLSPIMDLAAASGENLGDVSDIVTDALTAFGLGAEDSAMFTDVLAAASTSANTNVGLMGETFKYVAPLAGAMGYSVQDMAVAIGIMANSGIKGSQAGTALRAIISKLAKPTKETATAMKKLGVSLVDSSGETLPFSDVIDQLRTSFDGLSETEKTMYAGMIAGQEGMSALLALVNAGDEDFDKLTEAVENSAGATKTMADKILDNAGGDVTIFKSAIEGLEITLWGLIEGPFRSIVQTATKWVDSFRSMDEATQKTVLKVAGLAAAAGPALLIGSRIVKTVGKIGPLLSALVSPMGVVAAAVGLFAVAAVDKNNDIGKAFEDMSVRVKDALDGFGEKIRTGMSEISARMPDLCASIIESVKNIVPSFVDVALQAVTGFMGVISDNASDIVAIGGTIITSLLNGVSEHLPELVPAAASMVTKITTGITGNAPSIIKSAASLMASFVDGVLKTDWAGLALDVLNSLVGALMDVLAPENLEAAHATMETLSADLITALSNGIRKLLTGAGDIAAAIGELISTIDFTQLGADLGTIAVDIISNLATSLGSQDFSACITKIGDGIIAVADGLIDFGVSMAGKLMEGLLDPAVWAGLASGLWTIISTALNITTEAITHLVEKLIPDSEGPITEEKEFKVPVAAEIAPEFVVEGDAAQFDTDAIDDFLQNGLASSGEKVELAQILADSGMLTIGNLDDFLSGQDAALEYEWDWGKLFDFDSYNASEILAEYFANNPIETDTPPEIEAPAPEITVSEDSESDTPSVDSYVQSIEDEFMSAFAENPLEVPIQTELPEGATAEMSATANAQLAPVAASIGLNLDQKIGSSITANVADITAAVDSVVATIKDKFTSGTEGMKNIGFHFTTGLTAGILSGQSMVINAAIKVAQAAVQAVKNELQIGSPSKVLAAFGGYFTEGFANGIADNASMASTAARDMAAWAAEQTTVANPARGSSGFNGLYGASERASAIDYDKLADAMANRPAVWQLNGKTFAETEGDYTARADNDRSRRIAAGYGY